MAQYVSAIFLDFDNVFSSLFKRSKEAASEFATAPDRWLGALRGMKVNEADETTHNFVVRRCYLNPSGRAPGSEYYSKFRQHFVRDGWEVIDTPPLTNQGKTSADTHIVMDVLDCVDQYPHVSEYVIMAADADYTPLVIRLRKHMKTTVVYAAATTAVAYRAACDSIIDEESIVQLLSEDEDESETANPAPLTQATPEKVRLAVDQYFAESGKGHRAHVSSLGHLLMHRFSGVQEGWLNHASLSHLLKKVCGLTVQQVDNKPMAWKPDEVADQS